MTVFESVYVALTLVFIVFFVLFCLYGCIRLISLFFNKIKL